MEKKLKPFVFKSLINGDVVSSLGKRTPVLKNHYYQQQEDESLLLISKEAYDAIQAKNEAKRKALQDEKEAERQQWLKDFGTEFQHPDEAYRQFQEEKERTKRE